MIAAHETFDGNGPTPFGRPGLATGADESATPSAEARAALAVLPALALWGAADRTLAARHFLPLFAQAFPCGRAVELPGVGHYSPGRRGRPPGAVPHGDGAVATKP